MSELDQAAGPLARLTATIDRIFVVVSLCALFCMLATTTISVIGRNLFNAPIPDDIVINELLIVVLVFLPIAYVQRKKKHLSVSLLSAWMSQRSTLKLELLGTLFGALFFSILSYATFFDFYDAFTVRAYNEGVLKLPEYPSRFAVFVGVVLMLLRLLMDSAETVGRLRQNSGPVN